MKEVAPLVPGQLVRSRAGRDRGRYYLVLEVQDDAHALVVDGKKRPLENPKKKNCVHLQRFRRKVQGFADMRDKGEINNGKIVSYIQGLVEELE